MTLADVGSLVLVGAGKMGTAMAKGWLAAGLKSANLILVDPKPLAPVVEFVEKHGLNLVPSVPSNPAEVLVLAVKPQIMQDVLADARDCVSGQTLVLSIAAGIALGNLTRSLGSERVIRTMPNTPAQVGKGVSGAVAAAGVNAGNRTMAEALLGAVGSVVWFEDEAMLDALTAVSGSGPAYVFLLVEALAAAGVEQGLEPDQAMALARQTIIGAAALMDADPTDAGTLRVNVTSPGGTTAAALSVLMADGGMKELLSRAVAAARQRSEELGA